MKKILTIWIFLLPLVLYAQQKTDRIIINPSKTYQIIHGFGASDSWRTQFVGKNWPIEKRNKIADLLFSKKFDEKGNPKGIGLSTWRFYVGAGTMEQGEASGIANIWRRAECFQDKNGNYDWTKYEGQRWFLQAAKERGVENFLIYSISPPVHLSKNGLGYATKGDTGFNIQPENYDDYAEYLVDIIQHFENDEGIHFDYLSPFNEPQWKWDEPNQEGTPASNAELYQFMKALSTSLEERGLETQIVPGEAGSINYLFHQSNHPKGNQIQAFFDTGSDYYVGDLPNMKKAISGHSYFSTWPIKKQVETRQKLASRIQEIDPDLEYWQTEFCILEKSEELGSGGGRDLGMPLALYVARVMHSDLTIANSNTWEWWTALSQVDYKDGLIHLDPVKDKEEDVRYDGEIIETKLLWAMGNFSRFVRPGMQRIEVKIDNDLDLVEQAKDVQVAGFRDDNNNLVLVFINHTELDRWIHLDGLDQFSKELEIYVTDKSRSLEKSIANIEKLVIPKRSVSTVIIGEYQ